MEFLAAGADELRERHALFSGSAGGSITRTLNGVERTIQFRFDPNSGGLGQAVGVPFEEGKAKVNWRVYQAVINAAFATPAVTSVDIEGVWRPTYQFFNRFFAESVSFGNLSAAGREERRQQALHQAHMADKPWSEVHTRGQGLDLTRLNGVLINRPTTPEGIAMQQPEVLRKLSLNLRNQAGVSQVIQPWMTWGCNFNPAIRQNLGVTSWRTSLVCLGP